MKRLVASARAARLYHRFRRSLGGLERTASWHLGGGKRFFNRYYAELGSSYRWCFIVGCNNSGTSLLQSVLTFSGAVSKMDGEGQLHTEVLARAHRRRHRGVWTEYLPELVAEAEQAERLGPRLTHDWLAAYPLPLLEMLLEKSTVNTVRMPFLQHVFPNSYFIGLVRDGYAVSEGIRRKSGSSLSRCARHWNTVNRYMVDDAQHVDRYLEIRYEDLSANPGLVARSLAEFLSLSRDSLSEALAASYTRTTIVGADARKIGNMNPASWSRLSAEDVARIEDEAGEMLKYFDYRITEQPAAADPPGRGHVQVTG